MCGLLSGLLRSVVFDGTREAECPAACTPRASGPGPQGVGHPGHSRALEPAPSLASGLVGGVSVGVKEERVVRKTGSL